MRGRPRTGYKSCSLELLTSPVGPQDDIQEHIELRDIHFRCPGHPEQPLLRAVSLKAKCGDFVAIVGASSCGKSSVFAPLERFYNPDSGSVSVDGRPISQYNLQHHHRLVGLVSQGNVLFPGASGTISWLGWRTSIETRGPRPARMRIYMTSLSVLDMTSFCWWTWFASEFSV